MIDKSIKPIHGSSLSNAALIFCLLFDQAKSKRKDLQKSHVSFVEKNPFFFRFPH